MGEALIDVLFTGSLAAILAFACPLSHMITLMNASHLLGISIQALHFIIMRCVPTAEQKEAGGMYTPKQPVLNHNYNRSISICYVADIEYKRLGREAARGSKASGSKAKRSGLWFIPSAIRHTKTLESIKSKVTTKGTYIQLAVTLLSSVLKLILKPINLY